MNRLILTILALSLWFGQGFAQGIAFEHATFEEALAKAKAEDKLVFIDFYTDWCGPCKQMAKFTFTDPTVGDYYNKHFINLKLNAEKGGRPQAVKYGVHSYPTTIFLDGEGNVVVKQSGSKSTNAFLKMGRTAIEAQNSGLGIDELKKEYPNRLNDEDFLKVYIKALKENKESPIEAIEAWLKVQTETKESDVDMMEFLMENKNYIICGGKAEAVYLENIAEYLDIGTRMERNTLLVMRMTMIKATRAQALRTQNPELMRTFINAYNTLDEKQIAYYYNNGASISLNFDNYELEYAILAKDYVSYKKLATNYLDSIVASKPLAQIRQEDQATYIDYKENKFRPSLQGNSNLRYYEAGEIATFQTRAIEIEGGNFLKYCAEKKADYKKLHQWLDYGEQLLPDVYRIDNLRGDVYTKQGKIKEAIKYKESALEKIPERDRNRKQISYDLEQLKK